MASVSRDPNGRKRILFVAPNGTRKTIRLGEYTVKEAQNVQQRVERLLVSQESGCPLDRQTALWVAGLEKTLADKLVRVGLIESPKSKPNITLGEHVENYIAQRTDVEESTRVRFRQSSRSLTQFFSKARPLADITAGEARDFERWLMTLEARIGRYVDRGKDDGLATNTARKRIGHAKQFFEDAVLRELLSRNPFAGMNGAAGNNRERDFFIDREMSKKLLEACPTDEWRLIFALSRFGGLRCPSEHVALRLNDVDLAENRFLVRSPKTKRYEGKADRIVPIFPELRPHLEAVFDAAEPGTDFFITSYRDPKQNLRTPFLRIIRRAGLAQWPKLFQNSGLVQTEVTTWRFRA